MAFQQLQTVSTQPDSRYTGPYLSGDEIELLEHNLANLDKAWNVADDMD
jgi:hypothetical protein